jgi:hypothetical protein
MAGWNQIKFKYRLLITAINTLGIFLSFPFFYLFGWLAAELLGLERSLSVIDQDRGFIWIIIFFISLLIFIRVGFLVSTYFLIYYTIYFEKWSKEKAFNAFKNGKYPSDWVIN